MAGQSTPAAAVLARNQVTHRMHPYAVDADTPNYGAAVADTLGVAPGRVFKTLVTEVDGALTVAIVPVSGEVDLKALATAAGGKRAAMADRAGRRAGHRVRAGRHQSARAAQGPAHGHRRVGRADSRPSMSARVVAGLQVELDPAELVRLTGADAGQDRDMKGRTVAIAAVRPGARSVVVVLAAGAYFGIFFTSPSVTCRYAGRRPVGRGAARSPRDLEIPWGVAFLPDGTALVTERDTRPDPLGHARRHGHRGAAPRRGGARRRGRAARASPCRRPTPATVGVRLLHGGRGQPDRPAAARATAPQPIFTGIPKAGNHNGGRIAFGPDGMLYVGTGDAGRPRPLAGPRLARPARSCG